MREIDSIEMHPVAKFEVREQLRHGRFPTHDRCLSRSLLRGLPLRKNKVIEVESVGSSDLGVGNATRGVVVVKMETTSMSAAVEVSQRETSRSRGRSQ